MQMLSDIDCDRRTTPIGAIVGICNDENDIVAIFVECIGLSNADC